MSRPYTNAGKYSTQNECFGIYGILKGEKQFDDLSEMGEHEICIPKQGIMVQGVYVDTVGKNTKAIKEYIAHQLEQEKQSDQLSMFDPRDPLTGSK